MLGMKSIGKNPTKISSSDSGCVDTSVSSKDVTSSTVTLSNVLSRLMSYMTVSFSAANGSLDTASSSSISQNSTFLKQFCMVLSVTSSHDKTSIFIPSNTEMFQSDLLPSVASSCHQLLQSFFGPLLFCTSLLKEQMTP